MFGGVKMYRATTPKQIFIFEVDPSEFTRILITYSQNGQIILEKEKDDLTFEEVTNAFNDIIGYSAWFRMSQEETKKFSAAPGKLVTVQVRVLTSSNEALASDKKTFTMQDVLNDEVLV